MNNGKGIGVDRVLVLCSGIAVMIFVRCVQAHIRMLKLDTGAKSLSKKIQLVHACLIFACGTMFIAADLYVITVAVLDYPLFPGGPDAYIMSNYGQPVGVMGNTAFEVTSWLADAFMVCRCILDLAFAQSEAESSLT